MWPVHCPRLWSSDGIDARVVMPLYGDLKFKDKPDLYHQLQRAGGLAQPVLRPLQGRSATVLSYYFIDNEYYFKRSGLYGFYDDGERFAFFSRAILEMLFYTDFRAGHHQLQRLADGTDPRLT